MFTLSADHLARICRLNHFPIPDEELAIMGIRGCLPIIEDAHHFHSEHHLENTSINYRNPRCTLILWRPAQGTFAVFPGSTVPSLNNIRKARLRDGKGANRLIPCRLTRYVKGSHRPGKSTGHRALRNNHILPVRRSSNDLIYNALDDIETGETTPQFDNIHAGWCGGLSKRYDSAGCQVLVGYPKCDRRGGRDNTGPWKHFVEAVYDVSQDQFTYTLLNSRDYRKVALAGNTPLSARVRYGSQGELVEEVQTALQGHGFYQNARVDGDFGMKSLDAMLDFQEAKLGPHADDGVVGPQTALTLGINWPEL